MRHRKLAQHSGTEDSQSQIPGYGVNMGCPILSSIIDLPTLSIVGVITLSLFVHQITRGITGIGTSHGFSAIQTPPILVPNFGKDPM
jgi:hypothetical protein